MRIRLTIMLMMLGLGTVYGQGAGHQRSEHGPAPTEPIRPGEAGLLYTSVVDGIWQIFVYDFDTRRSRQVTHSKADKHRPILGPKRQIYYHTTDQKIFRLSSDGRERPVLEKYWPIREPAWSRRFDRLAFVRIRTDLVDTMNLWVESSERPTILTRDPGVQCTPAWSPDGTRLAFAGGQGWGTYELQVMGDDGGNRTALTKNRTNEFDLAWSPDGEWIAYSGDETGDYDVWCVTPDGKDRRRVTDRVGLDGHPTWSPNSLALAFAGHKGGKSRIWLTRFGDRPAPIRPVPGLDCEARNPFWFGPMVAPVVAIVADLPAPRPAVLPSRSNILEAPSIEVDRPGPLAAAAAERSSRRHFACGVTPKILDLSRSAGSAAIWAEVDRSETVSVRVVDDCGYVVRHLDEVESTSKRRIHSWDGRNDRGRNVRAGVYRYVFDVVDAKGGCRTIDPSTDTGGEILVPRDFVYDEEAGELTWVSPRAAMARLRVGIDPIPHVETLMDWVPITAGRTRVAWRGWDESKTVNVANRKDRAIRLCLFALPDGTVIVRNPASDDASEEPSETTSPSFAPMVRTSPCSHASHERDVCREIRQAVELVGAERDGEGRYVVRGVVPVRLTLDPQDRIRVVDSRYEVAFFVDLTFFFEEEDASDPLTYQWDTRGLPPGEHVFTVNTFSYDDHVGVTHLRVVVEE